MKALKVLAGAAVIVSVPASPQTAVKTGNELLLTCSGSSDSSFYSCGGFVQGVIQTVQGYSILGKIERPYCLPETVTNGQVKDVIVAYLTNHPAERHKPGVVLTIVSLREAFPCGAN